MLTLAGIATITSAYLNSTSSFRDAMSAFVGIFIIIVIFIYITFFKKMAIAERQKASTTASPFWL
jgi:hypothetical protein